jgi:hypothetical protein
VHHVGFTVLINISHLTCHYFTLSFTHVIWRQKLIKNLTEFAPSSRCRHLYRSIVRKPRILTFFVPNATTCPYKLRGPLPSSGCGRNVTDVWVWGTHRAQLRCPDKVSNDIYIYIYIYIYERGVSGGTLNKFYKLPRPCGPGSSVGIATDYGLDGPGIKKKKSRWGRDFSHTSRPALWPTQPPVQWERRLSRG